ncbi:MAG: GldG family protein [Leptospiraceae bacterium]|nr:GldG family protein [Leptospiraceae bacterium]MBK9501740.1 GldG family protein [Leptospiraceae bacterium]
MIEFFSKLNKNYKFISFSTFLSFFLFNYLISDFYCRKDLSRENRFNLTDSTEKVLQNLPEKLYIDAFYSSDVPGEHKARLSLTRELIKEIANVNRKKVELRFHDPDSNESDKKKATEAGIKPAQLNQQERGSVEIKQAYFGIKLTVGSKSTVIPNAYFAEAIEYQILSSLKKMLKKNNSSTVAILKTAGAFLAPEQTQGMGKDTFGLFVHRAFAPENGEIQEINVNSESIPDEIKTVLWVGSPDLTDKGKYYIDQFLMRGGNLLIFAKTFNFQMGGQNQMAAMMGGGNEGLAQPAAEVGAINAFLSHYGIEIKTDMILEPDDSYAVTSIFQQLTNPNAEAFHYPLWVIPRKESGTINPKSQFTKNASAVLLPWTSSIDVKSDKQPGAVYTTLIESTKKADKRAEFVIVNEEKVAKQPINAQNTSFVLGLHVEGNLKSYFTTDTVPKETTEAFIDKTKEGKKSQIVVFGSPYIVSDMLATNDYLPLFRTNLSFVLNVIDILSGDTDMLSLRTKQVYTKNLKDVNKTEKFIYSFLNILLLPVGIGIYAFLRLKKRTSGKR